MPIRALCTICSDFFDHSRDVAAIHCGHTFHSHCLIQWFETAPSRTCPQCRIQVGKRTIINKLYFDLAQEEENVLDAEFLKNELDNTRALLSQKEKEKRDSQLIIDSLRDTLDERNATVESLQRALDKAEMLCSALKKQMKYLEQQQDEAKQAREEARRLRSKMKNMERIELLLQSQRPEVEEMIRDMGVGQSAVEQLAVFCVSLKKEYENLKEARKASGELADKLKKDLFSSRSKLQTVCSELDQAKLELRSSQKDLQSADKEIASLKKKLTILQETLKLPPGDSETINRLVLESPAPVEMVGLKLRRPAFGDDIDLNATFNVNTPPSQPSSTQHGLAKRLFPEKAHSPVQDVPKKITKGPRQESQLSLGGQRCLGEPDEELASAFPVFIRNALLGQKQTKRVRAEPCRSTDAVRIGFDGLGGRTKFIQPTDTTMIRPLPVKPKPKGRARQKLGARTAPTPSQATLDNFLWYVLGLPAMRRIQGAKVLLSGLQGLGAEVAKNLVLMGVGSLTLHDPHPTCWSDLAAQFLLSEQDLGRSRAEASQKLLAELNGAVQVSVYTGDITEDLLLDFQVVVLTASRLEEQLRVGTLCHEHGVCFLVADTRGLVGQLFCDFGKNFTVQDPTEAEPLMATIQHISQGSPGILTLREEADAHHFHTGDWVTFSGIEGMVELNGCDPRPLHVREDGTLEIGDTTAFSRYLRGGAVTEVKRAKTVSHEPLDTALLQPRVVAQSPQEVHRARCLHQSFRSLHKFQQLHGRPPKPWDPVDAEMVVDLAQAMGPLKGTEGEPLEEQLDESLVRTVALSSAGGLSPMAAVLGAVAAQEVLKAISGKFMPLDQWLYFDALDCLPEDGDPFPNPEDCAPRRCRYDGQTAVFGADFQEKLSHQHYLLVGAGAVGCELLKGFALMGLGAGGSGGVTVADMDHVELSNLSRQFLFRSQDIHRQKAEVAAEATRRLNADLQVTPLNLQLDPTTEHIFGDDFFSGVDGVAAAVDTFEARDYVAARCTHFLKPLLEAGTTGTRGSAGVFIPHVTENYKAPSDAASEDAPDPVCTVRYIPATTEHTVQWAKGEFDDLFCESAKTINSHPHALSSPEGLVKSQKQPLLQTMRGVLTERPQTWRDCVLWALGHWQLRFHYGITQLLRTYPPDKVQEDGTPFWSGPKQCPQPLEFDASQDTHLLYVLAAANLYAQMHRLPGSQDQTALRGLLNLLPLPDPQNLDRIFASELELDSPSGCKQLHEDLKTWSKGPSLEPLTFEKDNDSNFHVDFVVAAASLRAQNYAIPVASHAETKRIVGRIIPAVVTTTAAVAGLVGLELYKVVGGPRPRHAFRHSYLHLAENYFSRWVPKAPDIQKFHHLKWTCWDRLEVPAGQPERTLESLLAHIQELQGLRVTMLLHGSAQLYSAGWSEEKQARHLSRRVTELVKKEPGQRVLVLELGYEGEEYDTNFPRLHYKL